MALLPGFGSLRNESWPPSSEWSGLNCWWGEDGRMRSTGLKKNIQQFPPALLTVTFEVLCTYIYLINIWQAVSSQAFYFTWWKGGLLLSGLWLFKVRLPLSFSGPTDLLASGVSAPVPQDSQGRDVAFIPLLSSPCRWEAAFCRRLREGVISHLWDAAEIPQLPYHECPAFWFDSLATEVLKKLCNVMTRLF